MFTSKVTSNFVGIGMKNELPEKTFILVLIRKGRRMDWTTKGFEQQTCTQTSTGETDCP
jgi:hypothetical protein